MMSAGTFYTYKIEAIVFRKERNKQNMTVLVKADAPNTLKGKSCKSSFNVHI